MGTGQVEYDEGEVGILEVAGDEALEPLLTGCVPELKTDNFAGGGDVLADEIDANGGLSQGTSTFLVGSNSLRMYRAMMELLPTFWSPTRTILNFWIELRLEEKLMLSLIIMKIQTIRSNLDS